MHRTVDPDARNCLDSGYFTDLAWISGFVDGARMQRLESYPGAPLLGPSWCDREDDDVICESDVSGVPTSQGVLPANGFWQVAPADDGSDTLVGVQLTEVEYAPGATCQLVYDVGGMPLVVARADNGDCLEVDISGDGLQHTGGEPQ